MNPISSPAKDPELQPTPPGTGHEELQGWIPDLATPEEIRAALEKAFDYRGDVTITRRSGERTEGYIFDRGAQGASLEQCWVRILPRDSAAHLRIRYSEIARLEFSGRDTAAGKSFQLWLKNYHDRKAGGEKHIPLEPDPID